MDFYSFECLIHSNITFGMSHANSIDYNIGSQYNVKGKFLVNRIPQKQRVNEMELENKKMNAYTRLIS